MIYYEIQDEVLAWCKKDVRFEFMTESASANKAKIVIKLKDQEPKEFNATLEEAAPLIRKRANVVAQFDEDKWRLQIVVRNKMMQELYPFLVKYMRDNMFHSWDERGYRVA